MALPLPDLMPLVHARDAALGKVAAIGTVNPRPRRAGQLAGAGVEAAGGARARLARARAGGVQPQRRGLRRCRLEALANDPQSRAGRAGSGWPPEVRPSEELKDIRNHWAEWRAEWERKLQQNEIQFLRSVADLQGASSIASRDRRQLSASWCAASMPISRPRLERHGADIQQRLWADLERIRLEYERLIHSELRIIRQRAGRCRPGASRLAARLPAAALRPAAGAWPAASLRLRPFRRTLPRHRGIRQGRAAALRAVFPRPRATCSISAAGAANFWS